MAGNRATALQNLAKIKNRTGRPKGTVSIDELNKHLKAISQETDENGKKRGSFIKDYLRKAYSDTHRANEVFSRICPEPKDTTVPTTIIINNRIP